jgi:hypothetical protein
LSAYELHQGDCLDVLRTMPDNSVDAIVTDPPYGLSFMGKKWDYDVPSVDVWVECLRVLKPGGHLLAFAGTRAQHRMAVRIEDGGFEIRDLIAWVYGSGFPKSLDVSKAIDKMDAADVQRDRQLRFTAWVRSTGLSSAGIDEITGTNMGGHYTTPASQPAVATREHFEKLRPHFGCDVPQWVEEMVDERTVESENFKARAVVCRVEMTDTSVARPAVAYSAQGLAHAGRRAVDITAAHTDAARQWQGWGTALKPALEPITVARKPLAGTVADNVVTHGTGALNIDGCRVDGVWAPKGPQTGLGSVKFFSEGGTPMVDKSPHNLGRWPANLIHDGSDEVVVLFPQADDGDTGSAARFFYCAKASKADRDDGLEHLPTATGGEATGRQDGSDGLNSPRSGAGRGGGSRNIHPTVKPTDLMAYLVRLVTPPGGVVLDPFMGSGSTGRAAVREGFRFIGIEREAQYLEIARARIAAMEVQGEVAKQGLRGTSADRDPHTVDLFGAMA